ncbi:hypothetical protein Bca52824_032360 [Brassica carinata]|uniref:Nascent polypeptide-associated complex subunit alpha-like UBA domain-containing protein n=1 Tax=Brassica carinata TaxID=52824 RepID=A0A8X7SAY6_BRACI|nr:hypothetical protein Bca52824_032360 [Brassica carinata]
MQHACAQDKVNLGGHSSPSRAKAALGIEMTVTMEEKEEAEEHVVDLPFVVGTDSSSELFSEANWTLDVSEVRRSRQEQRDSGREKEVSGFGFAVGIDGKESGYGSEPGYRGDVEFGYGESGYEILGWINDRLHLNLFPIGEDTSEREREREREEESLNKAEDIELVMTQAGVPRPRAVKALKAADGDIVSAIMEYSLRY